MKALIPKFMYCSMLSHDLKGLKEHSGGERKKREMSWIESFLSLYKPNPWIEKSPPISISGP